MNKENWMLFLTFSNFYIWWTKSQYYFSRIHRNRKFTDDVHTKFYWIRSFHEGFEWSKTSYDLLHQGEKTLSIILYCKNSKQFSKNSFFSYQRKKSFCCLWGRSFTQERLSLIQLKHEHSHPAVHFGTLAHGNWIKLVSCFAEHETVVS